MQSVKIGFPTRPKSVSMGQSAKAVWAGSVQLIVGSVFVAQFSLKHWASKLGRASPICNKRKPKIIQKSIKKRVQSSPWPTELGQNESVLFAPLFFEPSLVHNTRHWSGPLGWGKIDTSNSLNRIAETSIATQIKTAFKRLILVTWKGKKAIRCI